MNGKQALFALMTMLVCAGGTAAQTEEKILQPLFDRLDTDKNKFVDKSEFPGSDEQFRAMDRNRNGKVTFAEYKVSAVARRYLAGLNRYAGAPRERADVDARRKVNLDNLKRFDRNRDGRITLSEWGGAPRAFADLDLDRNEVLDTRDRKLAERRIADKKKGTYDEFEFKDYIPSTEYIYGRYDENKDQLLERKELVGAKFAILFTLADRNQDDVLDMDEIQEMQREVASRIPQRKASYVRQSAYSVPFSSWDKNNDERIDTGEWMANQFLFQRIDMNRDGAITKKEVARYKISVEGKNFVEKFDLNKDGKVTSAEFGGGRDAFRRADRNGDGVVSGADR